MPENRTDNRALEIYTLGDFQVIKNGECISETTGSYYKLWKLFKYLITHRENSQNLEVILGTLWPDHNYKNPKHTFQNLVYRLRKILNDGLNEDFILFSAGSYKFNFNSDKYFLDTEDLTTSARQANEYSSTDPAQSLRLYEKVLSLYQGPYLPNLVYEDWLSLNRDHYHKIFLDSVLNMIFILDQKEDYSKIEKVCDTALDFESYEENLHYYYIKTLLQQDKQEKARSHFKKVVSLFDRELGIEPSSRLSSLFESTKSIQEIDPGGRIIHDQDITLDEYLFQIEKEGVFFCDPETFGKIYRLEKLKQQRSGQDNILWSVTFVPHNKDQTSEQDLTTEIDIFQKTLKKNLRQNDVVTRWGENKILVLLSGIVFREVEKVIQRIENNLRIYSGNLFELVNEYRPL